MTQTEQQNTNHRSNQSGPIWVLWLIAGALVVGCVCSLFALLLLRQVSGLGWLPDLGPLAAATATPQTAAPVSSPTPTVVETTATAATPIGTPTTTRTPTAMAPPTATATTTQTATTMATRTATTTATQTATTTATQTATATTTPTPTATHTATATGTPTPTFTPPVPPSPTPLVCDSIYEMAAMRLAPGQTFQCTVQEGELNDLANRYPESPCSQTRITLDDGEMDVECRIGLRMNATLVPRTVNCRVEIEVTQGTIGFRRIIQEIIATQFNVIRYDTVCVDRVEIDDGQVIVAGYGR